MILKIKKNLKQNYFNIFLIFFLKKYYARRERPSLKRERGREAE
jgi:hypothetical protein